MHQLCYERTFSAFRQANSLQPGTRLFQVGERDWLAARVADPAVQGILHHDCSQILTCPCPVQPDDVRSLLGVFAAGPASAEAARAQGRLFTGPAVQTSAPLVVGVA